MTAKEIQDWRDAYYKALVDATDWANVGLPEDMQKEHYRHLAYEAPDAEIEGMAAEGTPQQAAEFELM